MTKRQPMAGPRRRPSMFRALIAAGIALQLASMPAPPARAAVPTGAAGDAPAVIDSASVLPPLVPDASASPGSVAAGPRLPDPAPVNPAPPASLQPPNVYNDGPTYLGLETTLWADVSGCGSFWLLDITYDWAFGDGGNGTGQTVGHTYAAMGTYTATVQVTCRYFLLPDETASGSTSVAIVEAPITGLTAHSDSPTGIGYATHLSATVTTGSHITYTWRLGDGATATGASVTHTYASVGAYTAYLTATNPLGTFTTTTDVLITPFVQEPSDLPGLSRGDIAWGDYDNDGDLDLLVTGLSAANEPTTLVFRNTSGTFANVGDLGLPHVYDSAVAWGDYDGDGILDLAITGCYVYNNCTPGNTIAAIYHGNGTTFTHVLHVYTTQGVHNGDVAWFDYDSNGFQDLLVTGCQGSSCENNVTSIFSGNGSGAFSLVASPGLPPMDYTSLAIADYDKDGRQDVLMSGCTDRDAGGTCLTRSTKLFRGTAGGLVDSGFSFWNVDNGSLAWGDYNNDGWLDFVLTGWPSGSTLVSRVYRNDSGAGFSNMGTLGLPQIGSSSVAWGDYDNDGLLDVLLTGRASSAWITQLYHNDGATFSQFDAGLKNGSDGTVAWADYTKDGRLDAVAIGSATTTLYRNAGYSANIAPSTPTGLNFDVYMTTSGAIARLAWDAATDTETISSGLSYNLRLGTSSGGSETVPPLSRSTGYRMVPALGNTGPRLSANVVLNAGVSYSWTVQSVDTALAGSTFAQQRRFSATWFGDYFVEEDLTNPLAAVEDGAVSWADYDQDGDLDLFISGYTGSERVARIYRNDGAAGFVLVAALAGVYYGSGAWADYNNDGWLDLLITGSTTGGSVTKLYRGPSFTEVSTGFTDVTYGAAAWGDYNNDGFQDLILTGRDDSYTQISNLYRNDGDGTFTLVANTGLADVYNGSVAWADYNRDGWLDLVLAGANDTGRIARVYSNNGDGTFTQSGSYLTGVRQATVAWGDYDADGIADLLVAGCADNLCYEPVTTLYHNNGSSFSDTGAVFTGISHGAVAWGDVDSDGHQDILISGIDSDNMPVTRIYRGTGTSSFSILADSGLLDVGNGGAAWGDFDNDGVLDIALTGYYKVGGTAYRTAKIYRGNANNYNVPPSAPTGLTSTVNPYSVRLSWNAATDNNTPANALTYNLRVGTTPGGAEIVSAMSITASGVTNGLRLLPQQGNNGAAQAADFYNLLAGDYYWNVQAVDFGFAGSDFSATERTFSVPYFSSLGAVGLPAVVDGAVAWARLSPTLTQRSELAITGMGSGASRITRVYQVGPTGVTTQSVSLPGLSESRLAWGDYDGDGNPDLAVAGDTGTTDVTRLYHGNGDGTFTENANADLVGVSDGSLAWGDYDNDGRMDLLMTGWSGATPLTKIYRNNGNGTFTDINAGLVGVGNGAAVWGDYNNDGYLDVVVAGWTGGTGREARIYRNNGNGAFTDIAAGLTGVAWAAAAWADYDDDGWVDLALAGCTTIASAYGESHCSDSTSLLYHNNGNGTFTPSAVTLTGVADGSATWADFDNDGDVDLLLTGRDASGHWNCAGAGCWDDTSTNTATLYRNAAGAFTALTGSINGMFKSAAAWADFDGDSKLDVVVAGCTNEVSGSCTAPSTILYRGLSRLSNAVPAAPSGLAVSIDGAFVSLSWAAPSDDHTPAAGLTYNVRVGATVTGNEVMPALASPSGALRLVPQPGNVRQGITTTLTGLSLGQTYYWTVQAIDTAFGASPFATGGSFTVPWFSDMPGTGLPAVADSAVAWGDYNADGRLDALITGRGAAGWIARVYTNNGNGTFTDSSAGLPGVAYSSAAWGDYDNDGDVDILIAGDTGAGYITRVYRNNGNGTFSNSGISLPGIAYGAVAWADYDRDGRLDILVNGWTGSSAITRLYLNAGGGVFTYDTRSSFTGLWRSFAAWADFESNGLPDLFLSGCADSPCTVPVSRLYRNGGAGVFTESPTGGVPGLADGASAWGDYDNDGAMDLLVTGFTSTLGLTNTTGVSAIFHNTAGVLAPLETAGLTGMGNSTAAWGDYDNDGLLDVLLTGYTNTTRLTQIYHNEGAGAFTILVGSGLTTAVSLGSSAWGDYNSDGRLDILSTGDTGSAAATRLYRNNFPLPGVAPAAPASPTSALTGTAVTLSWIPGVAGDTPSSGLTYNLRLGTTSGGNQTVPGMSRSDGDPLVARWGNVGQQTTAVISDLAAGTTYFWSVQAIDNAFGGSPFSSEGVFTIEARIQGLQIANDSPNWLGAPTTLTATVTAGRDITYAWTLGDGASASGAVVTHTYAAVGLYTVGVTATNVVSSAHITAQVLVPDFMPITATLPGISEASVAWGDFDNDGDLDLLLTGKRGSTYISKVYRNDSGTFVELATAGLTGVYRGAAAWGDYDNDGDLDIALTGDTGAGLVTRVYRNDGGGAFSPAAALQGVAAGTLAWGDYDNDGDLDVALAGCSDASCTSRLTQVFRNDGAGAFTGLAQAFTGVSDAAISWGDYDNDGRSDLLVTGYTGAARSTVVYRNLGGDAFASQGTLGLPALRYGSVAWFDMDRDGVLDLALCGESSTGSLARLYHGLGAGQFDLLSWPGATGVTACSVVVGDYNSDGLPDVLLAGNTGSGRIARVYANLGAGQFSQLATAGLRGMSYGAAAWGDYDNDGRLDLALAGDDGSLTFTSIYRANDGSSSFATNSPPVPPASVAANPVGDSVTLSWTPGQDSQTPPAGLAYNVRVGQSSGGVDTLSGMAGPDGYRRLPQIGNAGTALSLTLQGLSPRSTYRWSVQSVDGAFAGSPFTTESSFRATWFSPAESGLPAVDYGAAAWADFDLDGDLDVALTGLGDGFLSGVYSNNRDGTFTDVGAGLPGVYNSAVAWGDYDRDGIMDLALAGDNGSSTITRIYHNTGASFVNSGAVLPGITNGSLAWGDYDRDGDLDLFLSGSTSPGCGAPVTNLYRNDGGSTFTAITTTVFPAVACGASAWADADVDGDLDLVVTGLSAGGRLARFYRNDGGGIFTDLAVSDLPSVSDSSVAWGDYDGDALPDLVVTGWDGAAPVAVLLHNNGSGSFSAVPSAGLVGASRGAAAWGDYDNDGISDLVLAGCTNAGCTTRATNLYHSDGAGHLEQVVNSGLPGVERASLAWGDVNNDGDLDLLVTGWTGTSAMGDVYVNSDRLGGYVADTAPTAPISLTSAVTGTGVTLSWAASTDTETPAAGLTYNLRVGTSSGGSEVAVPQSLTPGGARQLPAFGNAGYGLTATLEALTYTTYYWSVQAVDTAFAGSAFATERTFIVDQPITGLLAASDSPTLLGNATTFTATAASGTNIEYLWSFGDGITATGRIVSHTYASLGEYGAAVVASNRAGFQSATTDVSVENRYISGLSAGNNGPTALGSATTLTATVVTGFGTSYFWSLGDGSTASGSTVTHTYSAIGQYTAIVTATNASSSAVTQTKVTVDQALSGLSVVSSGNTTLGSATYFTATTATGSNVSYHWDFGDAGSSTGGTVSHAYGAIGQYTATVVAANSVGRLTGTLGLRVDQAVAGVQASNDGPTALGFATILSATVSAGSNLTYTWDLGDGNSAVGPTVSHEYPDIGQYTAVVTVSNPASALQATTSVTVQGVADLSVSKSVLPGNVLAGRAVTFTVVLTSVGPFTATGVSLLDPLPAGVTFGGIVSGDATYDSGLNAVRWTGGFSSPLVLATSLITTPFEWDDIRNTGGLVDWGDDDDENTVPITMPWSTPFFGEYHRVLYVGTNGNVGFSIGSGGAYNQSGSIPDAALPNDRVAAFYADLCGPRRISDTFGLSIAGAVYTATATAPDRFIIQYTDWADWNSCTRQDCKTNTFQIVLYRSGPIAVYYLAAQAASPSLRVQGAARPTDVGMENAAGSAGLVWPGTVVDGRAWTYRPALAHTVIYTGIVPADLAPGAVVSSTARVIATSVDGNLADNSASAAIIVDKPELQVSKTALPLAPRTGSPITYTIQITNTGTIPLHLEVTDALPHGIPPTGVITWTPVLMTRGGTWSATVILTPPIGYSGTLTNTVTVASSEGATGTARSTLNLVSYTSYLPLVARLPAP